RTARRRLVEGRATSRARGSTSSPRACKDIELDTAPNGSGWPENRGREPPGPGSVSLIDTSPDYTRTTIPLSRDPASAVSHDGTPCRSFFEHFDPVFCSR